MDINNPNIEQRRVWLFKSESRKTLGFSTPSFRSRRRKMFLHSFGAEEICSASGDLSTC
jgi:hypothetical protein